MKRKVYFISIATVICLLFSTVAYAATASYSFSNYTVTKKTNTFTLDKGAVKISGTHTVKSTLSGELPPANVKVKYELFDAMTKKSCGSVEIAGINKSFSNIKLGTALAKDPYYIQVSTVPPSNYLAVSGSGTVIQ